MFRLLTFRDKQGDNRPGILVDQSIYGLSDKFGSVLEMLNNWEKTEQQLIETAEQLAQTPNTSGAPIKEVALAPPILYPGTLYCAGAN